MTRSYKLLTLIAALLLLAACQPAASTVTIPSTEEAVETATPTHTPTITPTDTPEPASTVTLTPAIEMSPTLSEEEIEYQQLIDSSKEALASAIEAGTAPVEATRTAFHEPFWSSQINTWAETKEAIREVAQSYDLDETTIQAMLDEINPSGLEVGEWRSTNDFTPEELRVALECEDLNIENLGLTQGVQIMVETKDGVHLVEVVTNFSKDVLEIISANPEDFGLALDNLLETKGDIPGDELGQPIKIFMLNDDLTSGKEVFEALGLHSAAAEDFTVSDENGNPININPRQEYFGSNLDRQIYVVTINEDFLRMLVATSRGNATFTKSPLMTVLCSPIMMESFAVDEQMEPIQVILSFKAKSVSPMVAIGREWADSPGWRNYDDPWLGIDFEIGVD